jgi:hypothetical protein
VRNAEKGITTSEISIGCPRANPADCGSEIQISYILHGNDDESEVFFIDVSMT